MFPNQHPSPALITGGSGPSLVITLPAHGQQLLQWGSARGKKKDAPRQLSARPWFLT